MKSPGRIAQMLAKTWLASACALSMVLTPAAQTALATGLPDAAAHQQLATFSPTDKSFISRYLHPGSYMPLSEIKPGMTGYGLTVWHGTKVEKFNLQVIGVVKKMLSGRDAILARLSGGEMGSATN
jgi:hypothetical protein